MTLVRSLQPLFVTEQCPTAIEPPDFPSLPKLGLIIGDFDEGSCIEFSSTS